MKITERDLSKAGKTVRITENELMEAIRQVLPPPPGPEWMTTTVIGEKLGLSRYVVLRRIKVLESQGRIDRMRCPHPKRGFEIYFRLKSGKPK